MPFDIDMATALALAGAGDVLFLDGQVALVSTAAALFVLHEARLLAAQADEDLYDLRSVLDCDGAELVAAALAPSLRKTAADALEVARQL